MKTPIQEVIELVRQRINDDDALPFMHNERIVIMLESLLEKEKEVIMEAYDRGRKDSDDKILVDELKYTSRDYYNENFL